VDTLMAWAKQYLPVQAGETTFVLMTAAAAFVFSIAVLASVFALVSPVRRRVQQLREEARVSGPHSMSFAQMMEPFAAFMMPRAEGERSRIQRMLTCAGYRSPGALSTFYGAKAALMLSLPLLVFLASPFLPKLSTGLLWFLGICAAFAGLLAPTVWLERRVQARQRLLRVAFPDALDLLVVCVESGLGLAPALQRVADELSVGHPELAAELATVNAEMRAGVERTQALKNLAIRTQLDDVRGLVALLVQTMRFGTSVADALRVYSEEFRDKRMQAAEEQAAKIGTKMIFPLVFCLFPSFFLVAIGPAVLRLMEVFKLLAH
jgi:tight adherence protein C